MESGRRRGGNFSRAHCSALREAYMLLTMMWSKFLPTHSLPSGLSPSALDSHQVSKPFHIEWRSRASLEGVTAGGDFHPALRTSLIVHRAGFFSRGWAVTSSRSRVPVVPGEKGCLFTMYGDMLNRHFKNIERVACSLRGRRLSWNLGCYGIFSPSRGREV